jgi:hypothetical protein
MWLATNFRFGGAFSQLSLLCFSYESDSPTQRHLVERSQRSQKVYVTPKSNLYLAGRGVLRDECHFSSAVRPSADLPYMGLKGITRNYR